MPGDYFVRHLVRSTQERNRDLLEASFMELHMFKRFVPIQGLMLFHLDPAFMSMSQLPRRQTRPA